MIYDNIMLSNLRIINNSSRNRRSYDCQIYIQRPNTALYFMFDR